MKNRSLALTYIPTLLLTGIYGYHFLTGLSPILMMLLAMVIGVVVQTLFLLLFKLIQFLFKGIDSIYILAAVSGVSTLVSLKLFGFGWPVNVYYPIALGALCCILFLIWFFKTRSLLSFLVLVFGFIGLGYGIYILFDPGSDPYKADVPRFTLGTGQVPLNELGMDNPSQLGKYQVLTFTYGSGTDKNRKEYREDIRFKTATVDASLLLPEWKGKKKKWREKFWGFGVSEFPLNGRVYMPEGDGPFPLALIVHGNHSMIDYSDDGYGYLGNLLASRGIITVSVDENFVNAHWSGDFRGKEMPVRAWLLLKHLELWQDWNKNPEHELSGKIDMENIMLMGHSRGGEAVTIAGGYNRLPYFPDNAKVPFDFNFNIKGIVSIAPTDYRYDRKIVLRNLDYLSIQGSYDSDEVSFWGLRPYRRLQFTDSLSHFKAGVYVHHANHGQFNTTWGNSDFGAPMKWLLNLKPLLAEEEQQEIAKVFISAFAEASLKGNTDYLPLFKNVALGEEWLPDEYLLTHFETSNFSGLVDFEEDIDITTAGDSLQVKGKNLSLWKEIVLKTRDNGKQDNNAVVLGWNNGDSTTVDQDPTYEINAYSTLWAQGASSVQMSIASGDMKWLESGGEDKTETEKTNKTESEDEFFADFRIELIDSVGHVADLKVSDAKRIMKPLKTRFTKLKSLDKEMIGDEWEVQLQTFHFPISLFKQKQTEFDPKSVSKIRFVFDQTPKGVVVMDDIGYVPTE
ncbi:hypothetical protein [Maribacter cobaltidurans]|uniref:Uncharacterized protein n=1 Tax=Maribacter cobaltidurans TaxID=1178778 RepID=A0A223VBI5_9FLAO|nr:hypothetical protein [Maribacter cobaltidurans]ASV32199.1 hypothetical protein CJ263_19305 [Maribacter cobaltidurans]GGD90962.1 hypothetical protein GCM10011412_31170 [Maribacter cobaltidurans]